MTGRLLPHPIVSALLVVTWLALVRSVEPLHVFGAAALAVGLPHAVSAFLGEPVAVRRPLVALRLTLVVILDIVLANVVVARLVLGPLSRLRPGFVVVPLASRHPHTNVLLANLLSMTPGTVSVEIDERRPRIVLHVLDLGDERQLVERIKNRYERPIIEMFG
jgi:multicomponent K+:H+ antiporter subunit E